MTEGKTEEIAETILHTGEKWWIGHRGLLESHGYRLRARYQPNWKPSWLNSGQNHREFEDGYAHSVRLYRLIPSYGISNTFL